MSGDHEQALVEARRLVRTLGSAPDARRRAQAVIAGLKRADGWSPAGQGEIAAADTWLQGRPPIEALGPRLRALLASLA